MNILFFGGTGFFGKAFLNYISCLKNHNINTLTIAGRNAENFLSLNSGFEKLPNVNFINADILGDLNHLREINYTHVIHAAADSTNVTGLNTLNRYSQIVDGTKNVLDFIKENLPKSKILFISSGGVYGDMPDSMNSFSENYHGEVNNLNSKNVYSVAKRTAEHLCAIYHDEFDIKVSIARCFCFSGIHLPLNVHFAIGNFIKDIVDNRNIIIKGDGKSVRSYLDQDDLSEWIIDILKYDSFKNTVYNIGSQESISIKELASLIIDISNKSLSVEILNESNTNLQKSIYVPNITKIKKEFNLIQKVSLEESISKMLYINT